MKEIDFYINIKRKIARLANFAEKKLANLAPINQVEDETEEDTIKDLAIYCIMELIKKEENGRKIT